VPISEEIIREATARYERERDRYLKLAARIADICRSEIVEANAIRAQVTWRAKSAKSFADKLRRFSKRPDKNCETVEGVFVMISDLAGVRIATYQPETEPRVTQEIQKRFRGTDGLDVKREEKDKVAQGGFYRATHCQVVLPDDDLVGTYENLKATSCEIQVCSMMAHVWNEIEHDIGYKPEGTGPQEKEHGLLQALGHLTRSGDEIITRLLEANAERLQEQQGEFEDVFEFVARLKPQFPDTDFTRYSGQLFDEAQALGLSSFEKLKEALGGDANFIPEVARKQLAEFNDYLRKRQESEWLLDEGSSDVVLILLLEKFAEQIEENHPAGRGMGRPPRIRSIATRYRQYQSDLEHTAVSNGAAEPHPG
jgi:ppGpp synthetase/RelA/SpoT-type nucleotidyltranferase